MSDQAENSWRKRIVVCSDGTGNAGGRGSGSNVWRIREAVLRKEHGEFNQVVLYEDGVGTQSLAPVRLLGNAFGFGSIHGREPSCRLTTRS